MLIAYMYVCMYVCMYLFYMVPNITLFACYSRWPFLYGSQCNLFFIIENTVNIYVTSNSTFSHDINMVLFVWDILHIFSLDNQVAFSAWQSIWSFLHDRHCNAFRMIIKTALFCKTVNIVLPVLACMTVNEFLLTADVGTETLTP